MENSFDFVNSIPSQTPVEPTPVETAAPVAPVEAPTPPAETVVAPTPTPQTPAEPTVTETVAEKEWWEKDEPAEAAPAAQTPAAPGTIEYAFDPSLLEDEEVKLFLDLKKEGKGINDLVQSYQVKDISKMTDREIVESGLKDFEGFTETGLEERMENFDSLNVFDQDRLVKEYKNKYATMAEEKRKSLSQGSNGAMQKQVQIQQKFMQEVDHGTSQLVGKEIKGLKFTAEMAEELKNYAVNDFGLLRPDGSMDVDRLLNLAMWEKYGSQLVKANVTKAKNSGREEVLKSVHNPSPGSQTAPAPITGAGDIEAAIASYAKK